MRGIQAVGLMVATLLLVSCATDDGAETPAPVNPPSEVGPASEAEIGQDWNTVPDTPVPAESSLSDQERADHLRIEATNPVDEETCAPESLSGQMRYTGAEIPTEQQPGDGVHKSLSFC